MKIRSRYLFIKTITAFLIYCNAINITGQIIPHDLDSKIDSLFANYSNNKSPGAVVGIMVNDSLVLIKAYGIANLEHNIPNTKETSFHIASITKQFTAYAISKLIDEGKLSYSDNISQYLPELPDYGKIITIDQLLHHTSGIRSTNSLRLIQDEFYGKELTQENALSLIYAQRELNFTPGSKFGYSNSGYILLATIIEKVTMQSFSEWLEQNVFKPLNMNHTMLIDNYQEIIPKRAEPYQKSDVDGYERTWGTLWNDYGATGIYTTVPDLLKWQLFTHSQKQLLRLVSLEDQPPSSYALGLSVFKNDKNEIIEVSMNGSGFGYTSLLAYYPKIQLDVVILSNIKDNALFAKSAEIKRLFMSAVNKEVNTETNLPVNLTTSTLKKYAGSYKMDHNILEFIVKEDTLYAINPNGEDALVPINETTFIIPNTPIEFKFDEEGKNMTFKMPSNSIICPKIEDKKETIITNLNEYKGQFYSNELNVFINVIVEDNNLIVYSPKNKRIAMSIDANDSFTSKDWSYHIIKFIRDKYNKIIGLRVTETEGRVTNLWFEKK